MQKNLWPIWCLVFALLSFGVFRVLAKAAPSLRGDDAKNYIYDETRSLEFQFQGTKYEWSIDVYHYRTEGVGHASTGALWVTLNRWDQNKKKQKMAQSLSKIECGSWGVCEVSQIKIAEFKKDELPLLAVEAGIYSGQGHLVASKFYLAKHGEQVEEVLCILDHEGDCGEKFYRHTVVPEFSVDSAGKTAVNLKVEGTDCNKEDVVEPIKKNITLPYDGKKFLADPDLMMSYLCYRE